MTKYSAEQINQYVKEMAPHTKHLVGTAMSVLKSDEELLQILADEEIAFSVRVYLFALIAEGFFNEDVERLSREKDIFGIVAEAENIRKVRKKNDLENGFYFDSDERDELVSQISLLLDEKLGMLYRNVVVEKELKMSDACSNEINETSKQKYQLETAGESGTDYKDAVDSLEELIDTAGYSLREHISVESNRMLKEILGVQRSIEGAKMIFFGRRRVAQEDNHERACGQKKAGQTGKENGSVQKTESSQTGVEFAIWCLRNMQDLSLKQCDIIYRAALDKKFSYEEIRSLLYDSDEKGRSEEEMAEQYERLIYKRKHAWKLEEELFHEENDRKIEMKTNWDS